MTDQPTRCPECDQPITQVGQFLIFPQHGQVSLEKLFTPLRIFLSYGHDSNEELVWRIKADLEKRGHDVWFDKSEIKAGNDWRRSITEGIVDSHRVLSFLSKYSARDPGFCLDEIAIAIGVKGGNIQTILVESEQEVKPPPSISHIHWLDMHDWKERRAAGEAAWEKWYQEKLAEIVAVVESDESRRFAGEMKNISSPSRPTRTSSNCSRKGWWGGGGWSRRLTSGGTLPTAPRVSSGSWAPPASAKSAFVAHALGGRFAPPVCDSCRFQPIDMRWGVSEEAALDSHFSSVGKWTSSTQLGTIQQLALTRGRR